VSKRALKLFGLGTALVLVLAAAGFISGTESLAAQSCTIILSPDESIQQAIDTAPSGAVICLGEGTWKENLVIIGKSLTIRGSGAGKTVIRSAMWGRPVVWIEGDEIEVNLDGVTITGASGGYANLLERCAVGLVAKGSAQVSLQDSTVSGNRYYGLAVVDSAQVTLQSSTVSGNEFIGLWGMDSAHVILQESEVSGNEFIGLWGMDSAHVILQGSTVSGNRYYGGLWGTDSAHVILQESEVSDNGGGGLYVWGSAHVILQGSTVSDNGGGLWGMDSAHVILQGSTVSDNRHYGLVVVDSARMSIEGSLIEGNGTEYACKTYLICSGCSGIEVRDKAHVELTNTTIRNNTGWGIAAFVKKCGHEEDVFEGTVLWEGRGNEIYDNGKGNVCLP